MERAPTAGRGNSVKISTRNSYDVDGHGNPIVTLSDGTVVAADPHFVTTIKNDAKEFNIDDSGTKSRS